MSKVILGVYGNNHAHWVGDGFPVRTLFSYNSLSQHVSPFLLLDYFGLHYFEPTADRRGSDQHPNRGFETVTIVYEGQLEHRDAAGNSDLIGPGDVQWMTAGRGMLHEKLHGPILKKTGGPLRGIQLWVNLPARHKMAPSGSKVLLSTHIPVLDLPRGNGKARVIAGAFRGTAGPARTFTPMALWDLRLSRGADLELDMAEGQTAMLVVVTGTVIVAGKQPVAEAEMALLGRDGTSVHIQTSGDATVLALLGQPIAEPIVGKGPFVMNTATEIEEAFDDWQQGRFQPAP